MRQTRLVLMVGGGILLLCVLALIVSFADYTSQQPAVANVHVPPVVGTPATDGSPTPADVPAIPVTTVAAPTPAAPAPQPAATPQRGRFPVEPPTLAQLLQELEQRRHHRPPQA